MIKPVLFDVLVGKKATAEAMASGGVGKAGWMQGAYFSPLFVEPGEQRKKILGFCKNRTKYENMKKSQTPLGTILEAPVPELYQHLVDMLRATIREVSYPPGVALTGGSSPLGFYQWLVEDPQRFPEAVDRVVFTVSDERCVPIESDQSNYGNALRRMMEPLGVSVEHRFPWDTQRIPSEAAAWYQKLWELSYGNKSTYDLCMLGMGDDAHTASLFPGSPLLLQEESSSIRFDAVDVPGKGARLTITPRGLERCGRIVVMVVGQSKSKKIDEVFSNPDRPVLEQPVNLFSAYPEKVTWLLDPAAASGLR